jgi:DNA polymerase-1
MASEGPSALPTPGADDVLWLIDLSNYVFRAYHALPPLQNSHGEYTNATLGTLNMLNRMIEDNKPAYLGVVMDSRGRDGFRRKIDPNYKANRSAAPADLVQQLKRTREIFEAYAVPIFQQEGLEADDIIATLTKRAVAAGLRVVVASADKDLMQLVEPAKVLCWDAMRNNVYGVPEVNKKFGVGPDKVRHVLALCGDTSDNVPGVPGVGPKTAAKLINKYGSLDEVFANLDDVKQPKLNANLREHEDAARRAFELVQLREDADAALDLAALKYGGANVERLRELFTELQFTRFLDMLGGDEDSDPPPDSQPTPTYRTIFGEKQLRTLVEEARASGRLAVVALAPDGEAMRVPLTGLCLSPRAGSAAYLPLSHRYLTAPKQLPLEDVIEVLGPLLADPAVQKVGHDLKHTKVVLKRHGMDLNGAYLDSMLASYLLDPESTHKLSLVAEREVRMNWTVFEKLVPKTRKKGTPKLTIEQVEVELATPYGCAHAEASIRLATRFEKKLEKNGLLKLHDEVEMPLLEILTDMEQVGVLVDPSPLQALDVEMVADLARLEKAAWEAAGREFNLSSPKQLEQVLFSELGLKSVKKTRTGRSTDHEALEAIADDHALPMIVLDHRATAKLKGTYIDALPRLINSDTGRIHTHWDQAVAATGRISSRDPNLQNIPVRSSHGKRIREAFVAPPGYALLSADYSQIELRVLAHLSHDAKLVEAFKSGQDVHVRTAMEVFGVAEADVTSTMRAQSKTVNFGVIYGMGPVALGKRLGIPRTEAKSFIESYFERYDGVRTFMAETLAGAQKTRMVHTLLGRRRLLPDLMSSNRAKRAYAERIAQNTPIQGSAADLLKLAMVKLAEPVVPGARMVLTVHDELVFEIPEDKIDEATSLTKVAMESIFELDVPLVVDVGHGPHWAAAH